MSLLQDIISEATSKDGDAATLLRKCLVLASRLQHVELATWARAELFGYAAEVPAYRRLEVRNRGAFFVPFATNTPVFDIPISALPPEMRDGYKSWACRHTIVECQNLSSDPKSGVQIPWPVEVAIHFGATCMREGITCQSAWMEPGPGVLLGIVDTVKTKVLDFALAIEAADPKAGSIAGVSSTLSPETVNNIFQTTISGGVFNNLAMGSQVDQQSLNQVHVSTGNLAELRSALQELGIGSTDVAKLESAIKEDRQEGATGLGSRAKAWLTETAIKSGGKALDAATSPLIGAATKAVAGYLGFPI